MKNNLEEIYWLGFLKSVPRKKLLLTIFYGVLRILISAAWPYLLYHYLQSHINASASEIVIIIITVIIVFILTGIASHRQSLINIAIMEGFSLKLVDRMWQKMTRLDWLTFHGKNRVYFFDMLMMDAWRLRQGMMALLEFIIVNSIIAVALTLFIAIISMPLFILCAVSLVLTGILYYYSAGLSRPYQKHFHNAWREQHYWVAKAVDQFDLVKMGRAYQESAETNRKNTTAFLNSNSDMLKLQSKWLNINQVVGNILRVIIFITGLYWVQINYIRLTDLLIVLLIVSIIQNNLMQLPRSVSNLIEGQEAKTSVLSFFSLPEEGVPADQSPGTSPVENISMRGLTFSYDDKKVIDHIDVSLEKGKIYLWKGINGSGKSTTAHILLGLISPQSGKLSINGLNVPWESLKTLRNRFAFINQDAPLFMGSIKENVLFGHPETEKAWQRVRRTWLSGLLPLNNGAGGRLVGDRGEGMSGGEARRLALIREWVRSADLFILDEPLNHLDDYAINEIKREIIKIKNDAIVIIISHQAGFENIADETRQF